MQFDTILFDLDGTLTDPGLGITNSILYALQKAGMGAPPRRELYQFIGPPLLKEFQRVYGVTPEQAQRLLDDFQVYFQRQGLFEAPVGRAAADSGDQQAGAVCRTDPGAFWTEPVF